jgi:hypothetical protein
MQQEIIKVIIPFFLFLTTFDPQNVHNMFVIMLDPHFKSLRIMENYVGHGETICLASKYDVKIIIPLLMTCFDQLNPTSQGYGTIIDVPTFHFEQKK